MKLTPEQQAMLNGEKGETMAKVVKTLVMYGDTFGAERMVPISSKYGHTVISFGLKVMKPVYDLYQEIIDAGLVSDQKFTADPKPLDKHVPSSLIAATSPARARCSRGRSRLPSCTRTPCSAHAATATPA